MTGVNYMGGSRKSALARRKDPNSLAQKAHFSKIRHRILSRGLSGSEQEICAKKAMLSRIGLTHARKDLASKGLLLEECTQKQELPVDSFPSARRDRVDEFPGGKLKDTNRERRSLVLKAIDLNDPIAYRSTLDQIVATPDLLGIAHIRRSKRDFRKDGNNISAKDSNPLLLQHTAQQDRQDHSYRSCSHSDDEQPFAFQYDSDLREDPSREFYAPSVSSDFSWPSVSTDTDGGHPSSLRKGLLEGTFSTPSSVGSCAPKRFYCQSKSITHYGKIITSADEQRAIERVCSADNLRTFVDSKMINSISGQSSDVEDSFLYSSKLGSTSSRGRCDASTETLLDVEDPWRFLGELLALPSATDRPLDIHCDPLFGLNSNDRCGLGFSYGNSSVEEDLEEDLRSQSIDICSAVTSTPDPSCIKEDTSANAEHTYSSVDLIQHHWVDSACADEEKPQASFEVSQRRLTPAYSGSPEILFERYMRHSSDASPAQDGTLMGPPLFTSHTVESTNSPRVVIARRTASTTSHETNEQSKGTSMNDQSRGICSLLPAYLNSGANSGTPQDEENVIDGPDLFAGIDDDDDE